MGIIAELSGRLHKYGFIYDFERPLTSDCASELIFWHLLIFGPLDVILLCHLS